MSLRSISCVDIYSLYSRFSLDLRLRLRRLLLFNLCTVILIMVDSLSVVRHFVGGCKSSRNLAVEGGNSDLCITIQDNAANEKAALPVGASNSIVMGLHFFLESVSVCLEELFEDVVDHIADTARLTLRRQEHELYSLNELRLYADF